MDPTPHLERFNSYEQARREFSWLIPKRFNIASAICRRHHDSVTRIALSDVKEGGVNAYTFGGLDFLSDKFATSLSESGVSKGDSVAVVLQPSAALAIAQLGALKAGAVVVPLSTFSDAALLEHAIADSAAKALVVDESLLGFLEAFTPPHLAARFVVRDLRPSAVNADFRDFWSEVNRSSSDFNVVETDSKAAAFLFYVEAQGQISGAVHSHRSVIGQLAAFEMLNNVQVQSESAFWTSDDWSSPGTALGVLYPAWWYGCLVVAGAVEGGRVSPGSLEQCEVTNVFIEPGGRATYASCKASDRSVVREADQSSDSWLPGDSSVTLTEAYGKPETGWILGKCDRWFTTPASAVGRPIPGRLIEVIDRNGDIVQPGETGLVAVHKSDPALFIEYRGASAKRKASFIGDWFLTGDVGYKNRDGDLFVPPSPSVVGAD